MILAQGDLMVSPQCEAARFSPALTRGCPEPVNLLPSANSIAKLKPKSLNSVANKQDPPDNNVDVCITTKAADDTCRQGLPLVPQFTEVCLVSRDMGQLNPYIPD